MKNILLSFLTLLLTITTVNMVVAQTEGYLKQEITEVSSEDEQMAMMLEMMKGTQVEYFYKGNKNLSKSSMMGGMVEVNALFDQETSDILLLVNAMGQKMMIESNTDEMEGANADQAEVMEEMEIVYDDTQTKTILGFECIKATLSHPEIEDAASFVLWISDEISMSNQMIQGLQYVELNGFPLEFQMETPQMSMTYTTISFEDSVDAAVFNLDTSGYQSMTLEEMMGAFGGGMGF